MDCHTKVGFLNDTSGTTPVFVRFSTVAGSKGSTDLARDVRGFSVKFYTQEGPLGLLTQIDKSLVTKVAEGLCMKVPTTPKKPINHGVSADAYMKKHESKIIRQQQLNKSDILSMLKNKTLSNTIATSQVAFLCSENVSNASVTNMKSAAEKAGASVKIIAPHLGTIKTVEGNVLAVDKSYLIAASVLFDAVFVPAGKGIVGLKGYKDVAEFANDWFKQRKIYCC